MTARAQLDWRLRANTPYTGDLVFDAARGRSVLFDYSAPWEWDGSTWIPREPQAAAPRNLGTVAAYAYDTARARTVFVTDAGSTWEWDETRWYEFTPPTRPQTRSGYVMAFDSARARIVLYGYSQTWEWDGASWMQRSPTSSPTLIYEGHRLAYDSRRGVTVLYGGYSQPNVPSAETWEWDGTTWVHRSDVIGPPWRAGFAMTYDAARGRTILFGGTPSLGTYLSDTWVYDGVTWTQVATPVSPHARGYHALAYDANRGRVVLAGGTPGSFDTWEWDGSTWRERVAPHFPLPAGRSRQSLAYDSIRGRTVYLVPPPDASTWEWDGSTWTQSFPATSPPYFADYALAFDAGRGVTVLLGGDTNGTALRTWEWDGVNWTRRQPATTPEWSFAYGSIGGDLAYDSARGVVVFFGRSFRGGPRLWEWDGINWNPRTPPITPTTYDGQSTAYDASRGRIVLFGAVGSGGVPDDTWEWDGQQWMQVNSATRPPVLSQSAMAYDPARGTVVLFGRTSLEESTQELWEWDGVDWRRLQTATSASVPSGNGFVYDSQRDRLVFQTLGSGTWELGPYVPPITTPSGSESGGDFVLLDGFNAIGGDDTEVFFGDARARVLGIGSGRIAVRTPRGSGVVDVSVANSRASVRIPSAYEFVDASLAVRYGNVGVAFRGREDVLFVNPLAGDPVTREFRVGVGRSISFSMAAPSSRASARFALYAWLGVPDVTSLRVQPRHVGPMIFPTPLDVGSSPQPIAIANDLAARLGSATFPTHPAPTQIARLPRGIPRPITIAVQGFIQDDGSAIPEHVSITNAILLRVQ
ncbi:MAG: hypothetical protein HYR85_19620 [Planctomycetes bacterium]|nr:hypothetical protein [Planctomycetota bacterium]